MSRGLWLPGVDRRVFLIDMIGERVLLKLSPMKRVMRFGKKGKLNMRYIEPFEILQNFDVAHML